MRTLLLIYLLTQLVLITYSQDYFQQGKDYFQKGDYYIADSFLTLHLDKYPNDNNARFNRAIANLYLNDTCSFCRDLNYINNPYEQDIEALNLYFENCGKTDTIFYDKKWIISDKSNYKFYEVKEQHRCQDIITGKVHDKNLKAEIWSFNLYGSKSFKTDLFAIYYLDSNDTKIYTLTDSPPSYPGGLESLLNDVSNSPYYSEAREKLSIPDKRIKIELLINQNGKVKVLGVETISPDLEFMNQLKQYIELIYSKLIEYNPGKLKGTNVDYKITDFIRFTE